jgi:hypothetical protein
VVEGCEKGAEVVGAQRLVDVEDPPTHEGGWRMACASECVVAAIVGVLAQPTVTGRLAATEATGAVSDWRGVRSIVACVVIVDVLQVRVVERAVAPPSVEMDAALDAERHGPRRDSRRR